jgi:hypothetical protein
MSRLTGHQNSNRELIMYFSNHVRMMYPCTARTVNVPTDVSHYRRKWPEVGSQRRISVKFASALDFPVISAPRENRGIST